MRFSEDNDWEKGRGYWDVICPDGRATFRLTRVIKYRRELICFIIVYLSGERVGIFEKDHYST